MTHFLLIWAEHYLSIHQINKFVVIIFDIYNQETIFEIIDTYVVLKANCNKYLECLQKSG